MEKTQNNNKKDLSSKINVKRNDNVHQRAKREQQLLEAANQFNKERVKNKRNSNNGKRNSRKTNRAISQSWEPRPQREPSPKLKTKRHPGTPVSEISESSESSYESSSEEEEEEEPHPFFDDYFIEETEEAFDETPVGFEYYEPSFLHFLTGWVHVKHSTLPATIIHELNVQMTASQNFVNEQFITTYVVAKKNIARYLGSQQQHAQDIYINIGRYIHAFKRKVVQQVTKTAEASRYNLITQTQIRTHLKNDSPFGFWTLIKQIAPYVLVSSLAVTTSFYIKKRYTRTPNSILWMAPTLSAYTEEILKEFFGMWHVVGLCDALIWRDWSKYEWHRKSMKRGFLERLRHHLQWNKHVTDLTLFLEYEDFSNTGVVKPFSQVVCILPVKSQLPSAKYPKVPPKGSKIYKHSSFSNKLTKDTRDYKGFYPILFGVSHVLKPTNSLPHKQAAIDFRLNSVPNSKVDPVLYRDLKNLLFTLYKFFEPNFQVWFSELKKLQKIRNVRLRKELEEGVRVKTNCTTFVKEDELLCALEKFIGRMIFSVSPYYLNELGDFATQLQKIMATHVWTKTAVPWTTINKLPISTYFACGATSADLATFVDTHIDKLGIHFMAMGDDIAAIINDGQQVCFVESDYSKFDRTQCKDMIELLPLLLEKMGYQDFANLYREMYKQKIVYRWRAKEIDQAIFTYPKQEFVLTGEPFTCFGNTLRNVLVSSLALAYDNVNIYSAAGFSVKYNKKQHISQITFLKGVFLTGFKSNIGSAYIWVRLPGFLVKFGKTLGDPLSFYPSSWSSERKLQQALLSQWLGYGEMETNWFYKAFGKIIRKLTPLALTVDKWYPKTESNSFSVISSQQGAWVEDEIFNSFILERYGITQHQLEDFLAMVDSITSLPAIFSHHILDILLRRDYM